MLLLLLNYVVLRALWKIDVHLISTLVNKSLYYYYYIYDVAINIICDYQIKKRVCCGRYQNYRTVHPIYKYSKSHLLFPVLDEQNWKQNKTHASIINDISNRAEIDITLTEQCVDSLSS